MSKAKESAKKILDVANAYGWKVEVFGNVLKIRKHFEPGNLDEYVKADAEWYAILGELPSVEPGSIWGDDGSGVGAVGAHKNGVFKMNKSGGSKRVLNALRKML